MKDIYIVIYSRGYGSSVVSSECYECYEDAKDFILSRGAEEVTPVSFRDSDDPSVEYLIKTLKVKERSL